MPNATVARSQAGQVPDHPRATGSAEGSPGGTTRLDAGVTARLLAEAEAEFDAALDEHCPMFALVRLDQEVVAATRRHQAALAGRHR